MAVSSRRPGQTTDAVAVLTMLLACVIWGLSPIYYKALAHVPPLELLSHRTLWSLGFIGAYALATGRGRRVAAALRDWRVARALLITAVAISVNWGAFIVAVQIDRAMEASLGYYIFPLVALAMGAAFHGERFNRVQGAAIALAGAAVAILTLGLGGAPWISLTVAISFGVYGLGKKTLPVGPISGVVAEMILLSPLAAIWLAGVHGGGWQGIGGRQGAVFGDDLQTSALLAFSGILTAAPLIFFSLAAQRLRYGTVGLIQYVNPTLQFVVAAWIFAEPVTQWHVIALPLIWLGLGLFSFDLWRRERRRARPQSRAAR